MSFERARRRELTQLVSDHVLRDVDGNELPPIVNRDRVPDHLGNNRRTPRPRFDHLFLEPPVEQFDFSDKVIINKRTFLKRSRQSSLPTSSRGVSR